MLDAEDSSERAQREADAASRRFAVHSARPRQGVTFDKDGCCSGPDLGHGPVSIAAFLRRFAGYGVL